MVSTSGFGLACVSVVCCAIGWVGRRSSVSSAYVVLALWFLMHMCFSDGYHNYDYLPGSDGRAWIRFRAYRAHILRHRSDSHAFHLHGCNGFIMVGYGPPRLSEAPSLMLSQAPIGFCLSTRNLEILTTRQRCCSDPSYRLRIFMHEPVHSPNSH